MGSSGRPGAVLDGATVTDVATRYGVDRSVSNVEYRPAGALLDVNDSRVRQLIRSGALPARKIGRDWLVDERDARAYMALPRGKPGRPRL